MGNCAGKLTTLMRQTQSKEYIKLEDKILDQCATLYCLPVDFLRAITGDFSEEQELVRGHFGVVYKGVFQNGKVIAVKKLLEMHLDDDQFRKEVTDIYRMNHKNIVKLVGYGVQSQWEPSEIDGKYVLAEVQKRLLCFEYITNSLDTHISSTEPYGLQWHMRYEIILGICRGLNYLHMEGQTLHMDLKPQNILLDENMEPKIADSGMFRLFGWQHSQIVMENGGATIGYMAPEYLANGLVSEKADIFSLGVISIEVITGSRDYPSSEESYEHFVAKVVGYWRNGLEAGRYNPLEYYVEQVETCILMGLMCVNADPNKRPTAQDILGKLTQADVTNMNKGPLRKQLVHLLREDAEILGKGTYGTVYKATMENGTDVVVRRFKWETTKNQKDFRAEVAALVKVRHPDLLAPIACFVEQDEKLIVMDYMPKGNLSAFLHARDMSTPANWATRMEIAKGIARGLAYLHDHMSIIHGNLTPRNVLLDEHSHPMVADFGLFRLLTPAANSKMLAAVSELVYYAPELCSPMNASTKTDVYSLGVIILQLLTGKLPSRMGLSMREVRDQWNRDMFDQELMQDEDAGPSLLDQLVGTLSLALECMNPSPLSRPQARDVVQELEHIHLSGDLHQSSSEWRQQQPADLFQESLTLDHNSGGGLPRGIPFHLLEKITDGFSMERKLGSGAFGEVYMGVHKNGEKIAVKMLFDMPGLHEDQFLNEFNNLSRLQHPNIVRLVGYCHETRKTCVEHDGRLVFAERIRMALCFEYMHFGSLDKYLSDEYNGLHWHVRYKLIKGICKGLKYLHEELSSPIYHLDLKPANILLDENMLPKIADFGLSRFFAEKGSQITRSPIGTLGYLPPEYIERNIISDKFDIFSLGVIIIKIVTGPMGYFTSADMSPQEFVELAHENWRKRLQATPMRFLESYSKQVKKCMEIALSSVVADRNKRPSIGDIVKKLDDETDTDSQILTTSSHFME